MDNGLALGRLVGLIGCVLLALAGCGTRSPEVGIYKLGEPYQIDGQWYYPEFDPDYDGSAWHPGMATRSTAGARRTARCSTATG